MKDTGTPHTINFTLKSVNAIKDTMTRSGDTQTDIHNRSVQIYNFLDEVWQGGGEVFFRRSPDAEIEKLNVR